MDGMTVLLGAGIAIGCATFLVAAFKARRYAVAGSLGVSRQGTQDLRGTAWIALAACGALYAYSSMEFLARLNYEKADQIRRKTTVASLDKKVHVYRNGLMKLHEAVGQAKGGRASLSPDELADHIEAILAEIRQRERKFR